MLVSCTYGRFTLKLLFRRTWLTLRTDTPIDSSPFALFPWRNLDSPPFAAVAQQRAKASIKFVHYESYTKSFVIKHA